MLFVINNYAPSYGKFLTHILQYADFNHRLCGTMRKTVISLIHCHSDTYTSLCGKSPALIRQYAVFRVFHHTVLYHYCIVIIRWLCGNLRPYIRHYAVFQGFAVAVQYLFLLVMQCIFRVINRITTHDVILFIEYEDHDTHKNGCNPHHFFLVLRTLNPNHSLK